ncbi:MAG: DNA-binding response regulator, partial [Deltaproteobacteria bacterium]|nr:DNA-binding response regulator [Deltaproteobacteria bacterium]
MAKIWVVDDDLFYRKLISEALRENNHEVVAMHNGMNLIELLTESR